MKAKISVLAIMICLVGCQDNSLKLEEEECAHNLEHLDAVARSYALQENLTASRLIDPNELKNFFGGTGRVPKCPSGTIPYKAFALRNGPFCPNNTNHTARFLASSRPQLPVGIPP